MNFKQATLTEVVSWLKGHLAHSENFLEESRFVGFARATVSKKKEKAVIIERELAL